MPLTEWQEMEKVPPPATENGVTSGFSETKSLELRGPKDWEPPGARVMKPVVVFRARSMALRLRPASELLKSRSTVPVARVV